MFSRTSILALALGLSLCTATAQVIQTQSAITLPPTQGSLDFDDEDENLLPQEVDGDRSALIASGKIPATPTARWAKLEQAFDSVPVGTPIVCVYKLRNVGGQPLVISSVKTRSAEVKVEFPKGPISTGAYGEIKVTYTPVSAGKFAEYLTVFTNSEDNTTQLSFLGLAIQP